MNNIDFLPINIREDNTYWGSESLSMNLNFNTIRDFLDYIRRTTFLAQTNTAFINNISELDGYTIPGSYSVSLNRGVSGELPSLNGAYDFTLNVFKANNQGNTIIQQQIFNHQVYQRVVPEDQWERNTFSDIERKIIDKLVQRVDINNTSGSFLKNPNSAYKLGLLNDGKPVYIYNDSSNNQVIEELATKGWVNKILEEGGITPGPNGFATVKYVDDKIASLVNSSPEALDTLKELADALGNDPNFATTVLNKIAAIENLWKIDDKGRLYSDMVVYSTKSISAKGVALGGGGSGGGINETLLWSLLGDGDNPDKQIALSHLSKVQTWATSSFVNQSMLAGYATQSWVQSQGYLTSNSLTNYVVKEPGKGLSTNDFTDTYKSKLDSLSSYVLPPATSSRLGGIMVGNGLVADASGILSTNLSEGNLPAISISKVTGLQTSLNSKLDASIFNDLFEKVNIGTDSTPKYIIRAKYGMSTNFTLSAKGIAQSGGSGGGGINEQLLWAILANEGTEQIAKNHLTTALSGYVLSTDIRLSNARPASDVYEWAKQINKPTYSYSEITGTPPTVDLSNYVTLNSAQTISGQKTFTSPIYLSNTAIGDSPTEISFYTREFGGQGLNIRNLLISSNYADRQYLTDEGLWAAGSLKASSFVKHGGTANQVLRADGGVSSFNWIAQQGQPEWIWGGNSPHDYFVWNPANFRVANANTLNDIPYTKFCRMGVGTVVSGTDANYLYDFGMYVNNTGNGTGNSNFPGTYGRLFNWGNEYCAVQMHCIVGGDMSFRSAEWAPEYSPWRTLLDSSNWKLAVDGWYLPVTGGALSGNLTVGGIVLDYNNSYIRTTAWFENITSGFGLYNRAEDARWSARGGYWNSDKAIAIDHPQGGYINIKRAGVDIGYFGQGSSSDIGLSITSYKSGKSLTLNHDGDLTYGGSRVWHAGNDGTGSGLDADMLDGVQLKSIIGFDTKRDFINGTLITTDIDYSGTSGDPFYLEIKGNVYGRQYSCLTQAQGYIYYGTIINYGVTHLGYAGIVGLVALNVNGRLCFWFPRQGYWEGYSIFVSSAVSTSYNRVIAIDDVAKPVGTKEVIISEHTSTSAFLDSNVASATKLQTARLIYGQPFDGTGNVDGNFSTSGDIYSHGIIKTQVMQLNGQDLVINGRRAIVGDPNRLYINYANDFAFTDIVGPLTVSGNIDVAGNSHFNQKVIVDRNRFSSSASPSISLAIGDTDTGFDWISDGAFKVKSNGVDIATINLDGIACNKRIYTTEYLQADSHVRAGRIFAGFDSGVTNSVSCSDWFRSSGDTGWYNQTYNIGIYAKDSIWLRAYGTNKFAVANTEADSIRTSGGIFAENMIKSNAGRLDLGMASFQYDPVKKIVKLILSDGTPCGFAATGQLAAKGVAPATSRGLNDTQVYNEVFSLREDSNTLRSQIANLNAEIILLKNKVTELTNKLPS